MERIFEINLPSAPEAPPKRSLPVRAMGKLKRILAKSEPENYPTARGWPQMPYPNAEIVYWRPHNTVNFGDELGRTIVELMLARKGYTVFDSVKKPRAILSIGSIIHFAQDNDVIWGSGVNGSVSINDHQYRNLDVRAVRGPITRQFLKARGIHAPEVYGDPALLTQKLTGFRFNPSAKFSVGVVPNMFDMRLILEEKLLEPFSGVKLIDPMGSWNEVIEKIVECEYIVSSSLHGLVIADTYGIPSRYIRLTDHEGLLKYEDYYEGTGRRLTYAKSVKEALEKGPTSPLAYDTGPLESAFPYDIWA
jgi:pyruvyltransferase